MPMSKRTVLLLVSTFLVRMLCILLIVTYKGDAATDAASISNDAISPPATVRDTSSEAPRGETPVAPAARVIPGDGVRTSTNASKPFPLYMANIERAKAGEARSQYRIAQAIQMCRTAARTQDDIDKAQASGRLSEEFIAAMTQHHRDCKNFLPLLQKPDEEFVRWLRRAAEAGDPLAKAWDALWSYPNFDENELRALVLDAVETGEPEARRYVVMYYANVPQTASDAEARYEAWVLLDCEGTPGCDVSATRNRQKQEYNLVEYVQISSAEASIREALESKQWGDLGLSPP